MDKIHPNPFTLATQLAGSALINQSRSDVSVLLSAILITKQVYWQIPQAMSSGILSGYPSINPFIYIRPNNRPHSFTMNVKALKTVFSYI